MDINLNTHSRSKKSMFRKVTLLDRTYNYVDRKQSKYILNGFPKVSILTANVKV